MNPFSENLLDNNAFHTIALLRQFITLGVNHDIFTLVGYPCNICLLGPDRGQEPPHPPEDDSKDDSKKLIWAGTTFSYSIFVLPLMQAWEAWGCHVNMYICVTMF